MFTRQAVEGVLMASKHRKFHRVRISRMQSFLKLEIVDRRHNGHWLPC